jgi:hypothetical protein
LESFFGQPSFTKLKKGGAVIEQLQIKLSGRGVASFDTFLVSFAKSSMKSGGQFGWICQSLRECSE